MQFGNHEHSGVWKICIVGYILLMRDVAGLNAFHYACFEGDSDACSYARTSRNMEMVERVVAIVLEMKIVTVVSFLWTLVVVIVLMVTGTQNGNPMISPLVRWRDSRLCRAFDYGTVVFFRGVIYGACCLCNLIIDHCVGFAGFPLSSIPKTQPRAVSFFLVFNPEHTRKRESVSPMKKFLNRIGSPLRNNRKNKEEKDAKSSEKKKRLRTKTSGMALGVLGAKYFYKNSKSEKPLTPSYIESSDSMGTVTRSRHWRWM